MVTRNRRRRRNRRNGAATSPVIPQIIVTPPPPTTGRQRRRRLQRQRRTAFLRECRNRDGVDGVPPVASAPSGPIEGLGRDIPGLPITTGMTDAGAKWALKALHPNGEEVTAVSGIPDHVSQPVVSPEFRNSVVVPPTAPVVDGNDNVDIIVLPFADLVAIYRRYKSSTTLDKEVDWLPIWAPTFTLRTANTLLPSQFDQTAVAKYVTQTTVPVMSSDYDTVYGYSRQTYKGLTVHLDASAMYDQGRITTGTLALPFRSEAGVITVNGWQVKIGGDPTSDDAYSDYFSLGDVPLDESCLTQASPGTTTREAREGTYAPIGFRDTVHLFSSSGSKALLAVRKAGRRFPQAVTGAQFAAPGGGEPPYTGSVGKLYAPQAVFNGLTTVVLIRGIDKTANVHIKLRSGVEAQVETCSTIAPYQRMSPPLDLEAINAVARLQQELPQSYPASYNDFGGLIGAIINVTKKIRGKVADMGIPGISGFMKLQNKMIYQPLGLNAPVPSRSSGRPSYPRGYDNYGNIDPMVRPWNRNRPYLY